MSMMCCEACDRLVDTDYHAEMYREDLDKWYCDVCYERLTEHFITCPKCYWFGDPAKLLDEEACPECKLVIPDEETSEVMIERSLGKDT